MIKKLRNDAKGFTLIELMIVIAIIGILAAIAIPQFSAYRIRAFNGSAQSDVRNLATSEAAFFADWQVYGVSAAAAAVGGGAGAIIVGPGTATDLITAADGGGTNRTLQVPLGNGVSAVATTNAGGVAIAVNTTFTAVSKHAQGDTYVGTDGDSSAMYVDPVAGSTGTLLVLGTEPASTAADDFAGVNGPSGINWTIK